VRQRRTAVRRRRADQAAIALEFSKVDDVHFERD
jgi:hypothetical protein